MSVIPKWETHIVEVLDGTQNIKKEELWYNILK